MNLLQILDKLTVLRDNNRIPDTAKVVIEQVDKKQGEETVVGIETQHRYGEIVVVIQVQEYY